MLNWFQSCARCLFAPKGLFEKKSEGNIDDTLPMIAYLSVIVEEFCSVATYHTALPRLLLEVHKEQHYRESCCQPNHGTVK